MVAKEGEHLSRGAWRDAKVIEEQPVRAAVGRAAGGGGGG